MTAYSNEKFAALIEAQGRRHDWLAEQLEVDPSYISKLKSGDKPLTERLAKRAALAMGVLPSFFLSCPCADAAAQPVDVLVTEADN